MKTALAVFALLCCGTGCVRASESLVRDQAATAFSCADYALTVVEVGPDVYRASGCGQELIYACHPTRPARAAQPGPSGTVADTDSDVGDQAVIACARTPE